MPHVSLRTVLREWLRLGAIGFGGPPAHIALLRTLTIAKYQWMDEAEFEHAVATTGLLPGPASTQMAIYCAWRVRGVAGALVGGVSFILPGLVMIVALSAAFFQHHPDVFILGAAMGAGAVVPAVALSTAVGMITPSFRSTAGDRARRWRWLAYVGLGTACAIWATPYVVLTLITCGLAEITARRVGSRGSLAVLGASGAHALVLGGSGALAWVAFKVGALSYGGGFVIIPLMQHDVVSVYHWMTGTQFLNAVALGQVTPGPVVLTTAAVGYAACGVWGALLATLVAFGPSFAFVIGGAGSFERVRANTTAQSFLAGAGPSVIGAIAGSSVPLAAALVHLWQIPLLIAGATWLLWRKSSTVYPLLAAALIGAALAHVVPV